MTSLLCQRRKHDELVPACCNCGSTSDLELHEGEWWCREYGACDLTLYQQFLSTEMDGWEAA